MMPTPYTGIYITWEAAAVIVTGLTILCGCAALYVRTQIRVALADFKDALLAGLSQEYVCNAVCHERHCAMDRRLVVLEERK